jgi:hypothetical protein
MPAAPDTAVTLPGSYSLEGGGRLLASQAHELKARSAAGEWTELLMELAEGVDDTAMAATAAPGGDPYRGWVTCVEAALHASPSQQTEVLLAWLRSGEFLRFAVPSAAMLAARAHPFQPPDQPDMVAAKDEEEVDDDEEEEEEEEEEQEEEEIVAGTEAMELAHREAPWGLNAGAGQVLVGPPAARHQRRHRQRKMQRKPQGRSASGLGSSGGGSTGDGSGATEVRRHSFLRKQTVSVWEVGPTNRIPMPPQPMASPLMMSLKAQASASARRQTSYLHARRQSIIADEEKASTAEAEAEMARVAAKQDRQLQTVVEVFGEGCPAASCYAAQEQQRIARKHRRTIAYAGQFWRASPFPSEP